MADKSLNIDTGKKAETLAFEYLVANGYTILALNWRHKRAEIDIIASKNNILIFVEVKSRSSSEYGSPELAVTQKKKSMIVAGATSYMDSINYDKDIRFDIISVLFEDGENFTIEHYPDAFFPGL